jgi:hypothetical protein
MLALEFYLSELQTKSFLIRKTYSFLVCGRQGVLNFADGAFIHKAFIVCLTGFFENLLNQTCSLQALSLERIMKLLIMYFSPISHHCLSQISSSALGSQTFSIFVILSGWEAKFRMHIGYNNG